MAHNSGFQFTGIALNNLRSQKSGTKGGSMGEEMSNQSVTNSFNEISDPNPLPIDSLNPGKDFVADSMKYSQAHPPL